MSLLQNEQDMAALRNYLAFLWLIYLNGPLVLLINNIFIKYSWLLNAPLPQLCDCCSLTI